MKTDLARPARRLAAAFDSPRHHRTGSARFGLGLAAAGTLYAAYRLAVRRWHRHWGATPEECERALPGDEFVPEARFRTTRAITIDAPVDQVWPWLVQLGQDRAGFYSYDGLERMIGADIHNADEIHADWQELQVGDDVWMAPKDRFDGQARMRVAVLEPGKTIVLGPPTREVENTGSWAFYIEPAEGERTRLIVRTQGTTENAPPFFFLFDAIHFVMERKMMLGIKERAERMRRRLVDEVVC